MIGREHLRVGPAGWIYPDWKGRFYPESTPRDFSELTFLAEHFDFVEINSSYYHPPAAQAAQKWVRAVARNPRFKFSAKLWQKFVLERSHFTSEDIRAVQKSIDVLLEAERFAGLLIQFPQSFHNSLDNRSWLFRIMTAFNMYHLVIEFRHLSWDQPEILELLRSRNVSFANIDQPVVGRGLGFTCHQTSPIVYFRFHGRNRQMWFDDSATRDDRYNYDYSRAEIEEFTKPVQESLKKSEAVYVVFNNHFRGLALKNGFEFIYTLTGSKPVVPAQLARTFPDLVPIRRPGNPEQLDLF